MRDSRPFSFTEDPSLAPHIPDQILQRLSWRAVSDRLLVVMGALCLVGLSGCWTAKAEGDALRKDIETLKKTLAHNAKKAKDDRDKLQTIMEQATALLTRNSADVGAQVERMQTKVAAINGEMEELKHKLTDLTQKYSDFQAKVDVKLENLTSEKNAPVPDNKDELFSNASNKLAARDHQEARRLLRHFISRFADDPRVDKAQLMLGESYFAEQKFAQAIVEYKKIIEQYKQSAEVPEALAKIGTCWYQMKFCTDAAPFFSQLLKRYPKHPQAATARKILNLIRRYRRNRNVCRP